VLIHSIETRGLKKVVNVVKNVWKSLKEIVEKTRLCNDDTAGLLMLNSDEEYGVVKAMGVDFSIWALTLFSDDFKQVLKQEVEQFNLSLQPKKKGYDITLESLSLGDAFNASAPTQKVCGECDVRYDPATQAHVCASGKGVSTKTVQLGSWTDLTAATCTQPVDKEWTDLK
jgi:hypothetical protein